MKVIAHRGNKRYAPENTMAGFMSAASYEIGGIEFDVQWTKDEIPVVIHDPKIDRTTNGRGEVRSFSLQELKQFDAGSSFSESFRGEKIPSFEEVLNWARHYTFDLHVELKKQEEKPGTFIANCLHEIEKYNLVDRVVISTFHHSYIPEIKRQNPKIQTALLTKTPIFRGTKYAKRIKANGIHIRHSYQAASYYRRWSQKGVPVRVYNIQTPNDALKCKRLGVAGIITDDPKRMIQSL